MEWQMKHGKDLSDEGTEEGRWGLYFMVNTLGDTQQLKRRNSQAPNNCHDQSPNWLTKLNK